MILIAFVASLSVRLPLFGVAGDLINQETISVALSAPKGSPVVLSYHPLTTRLPFKASDLLEYL
jgi:hypothetical protein